MSRTPVCPLNFQRGEQGGEQWRLLPFFSGGAISTRYAKKHHRTEVYLFRYQDHVPNLFVPINPDIRYQF